MIGNHLRLTQKINPKDYWLEVLEKFPLDGTEERKLRHLMISKELQNIS